MGCIDFLWGSGGINLNIFCKDPSAVKTKLLELVKVFKFDGYSLNIDVDGTSEDVKAILDIMSYLKSNGIYVCYYDAMKDKGRGKLIEQDILPYYIVSSKLVSVRFDFNTDWDGGSSLLNKK